MTRNAVLFGMVREVPNGFRVQVRDDEWRVGQAYLKRENHPDSLSLFNEYFLLASVHSPSCLAVIIDSTDPNKERQNAFDVDGVELSDISAMKEFILHASRAPDGSIQLTGWREQNQLRVTPPLVIKARMADEKLCGDDDSQAPKQALLERIFGITNAFAQGPPMSADLEKIKAALQNDDAFVRRDARSYLAHLGADGAPIISKLLSSDNYRLELGGLAAFAEMPESQRVAMSDEIKNQVKSYTNNSDPTMRETALRALNGLH
jgi:hypothetical protein